MIQSPPFFDGRVYLVLCFNIAAGKDWSGYQ